MSVLLQDLSNIEVIVVDDCSTDDTIHLLRQIKDHRLRLVKLNENGGAPNARNVGVEHARSQLVAFQDSDDYWLPDKLSKQLDAIIKSHATEACYCRLIQYYPTNVRVVPSADAASVSGDISIAVLRDSFVSTQTLLMTRDLFRRCGGFDVHMKRLQDWDLVIRLSRLTQFAFVDEALAIAYETPGSLTSSPLNGVRAREAIILRYQSSMVARPSVIERHYSIMASICLHHDEPALAMRYSLRAIRSRPHRPKNWIIFLASIILFVVKVSRNHK
ncbi:glycosyltransferase family 2 protein [Glacieibacterium megasporae]|uniref:glycosyltransferase family 2 protein n=1 Tax=Glacieibacterium megasporae TaxID=2835787 RepID=UPI00210752AA|nr:glycosyltransferase family A protein [Polymorphobacter megasporae]